MTNTTKAVDLIAKSLNIEADDQRKMLLSLLDIYDNAKRKDAMSHSTKTPYHRLLTYIDTHRYAVRNILVITNGDITGREIKEMLQGVPQPEVVWAELTRALDKLEIRDEN